MCNRYALDSLDEISDLYQLRSIGSFGFGFVFPRHAVRNDDGFTGRNVSRAVADVLATLR